MAEVRSGAAYLPAAQGGSPVCVSSASGPSAGPSPRRRSSPRGSGPSLRRGQQVRGQQRSAEDSRGQQRSAEVKPSGSNDLLLVPPLACLVLLLWRAGGQVVLQAPPQLLATPAATEAVVGVGVGRHTHYTIHGLTCSEVPNHRQQVKAPPGVSFCV